LPEPATLQQLAGRDAYLDGLLVALHSRAKVAVMAAMSTKSREVIYGGRIIGAKIRAEGAGEAAQKAVREADRAAAELWSIQMEAYGGPAQPSPTIGQCLNGGYGIKGRDNWSVTFAM
jgi:hypothetical protein